VSKSKIWQNLTLFELKNKFSFGQNVKFKNINVVVGQKQVLIFLEPKD
jgi:hypothetical protein